MKRNETKVQVFIHLQVCWLFRIYQAQMDIIATIARRGCSKMAIVIIAAARVHARKHAFSL